MSMVARLGIRLQDILSPLMQAKQKMWESYRKTT